MMIKNKKGITGKALTVIICSLLILILLFGFYYGLKSSLEKKVEKSKVKVADYKNKQKMLSLFTPKTTKELLNGDPLRFKEALKKLYGKNVQCKLKINGEEINVGCEEIQDFTTKLELRLPREELIEFEVVS